MFDQPPIIMTLFAICGTLSLISITIAIISLYKARKMRRALTVLLSGKDGANLEEIISRNNQKIGDFDTEIQELFNISNKVHKQAHRGIHKIGLIKFNPFRDYTGNQSFALALLNSADDGITISSIHTREGTRIYVKEIKKGAPVNNELTKEEQHAITTAQ
jgi:hypothetical protein